MKAVQAPAKRRKGNVQQQSSSARIFASQYVDAIVQQNTDVMQDADELLAETSVTLTRTHRALDKFEETYTGMITTRPTAEKAVQKFSIKELAALVTKSSMSSIPSAPGAPKGPRRAYQRDLAMLISLEPTVKSDNKNALPLGGMHDEVLREFAMMAPIIVQQEKQKQPNFVLRGIKYAYNNKTNTALGLAGVAVVVAYFYVPVVGSVLATGMGYATTGAAGTAGSKMLLVKFVTQVGVPIGRAVSKLGKGRGLLEATPEVLQILFTGNPEVIGYIVGYVGGPATFMLSAVPFVTTGAAQFLGVVSGRVAVAGAGIGVANLSRWTISWVYKDIYKYHKFMLDAEVAAERDRQYNEMCERWKANKLIRVDEDTTKPRLLPKARRPTAMDLVRGGIFLINAGGLQVIGGTLAVSGAVLADMFLEKVSAFAMLLSQETVQKFGDAMWHYLTVSITKFVSNVASIALRAIIAYMIEMALWSANRLPSLMNAGAVYEIRGYSIKRLWELTGAPFRLRRFYRRYLRVPTTDPARWTAAQKLRNMVSTFFYNWLLTPTIWGLQVGRAVSIQMIADQQATHVEWMSRQFSQRNATFTVHRVTKTWTNLMRKRELMPTDETVRNYFFPYLKRSLVPTGGTLMDVTGTKWKVQEDTSDRFTSTLLLQNDAGEQKNVDMLLDHTVFDTYKVFTDDANGFSYEQEFDINAAVVLDSKVYAAEHTFSPENEFVVLAEYIHRGMDPDALGPILRPLFEQRRQIDELQALLHQDAIGFAQTFAVMKDETQVAGILQSGYIGKNKTDLPIEWQIAHNALLDKVGGELTASAVVDTAFSQGKFTQDIVPLLAKLSKPDIMNELVKGGQRELYSDLKRAINEQEEHLKRVGLIDVSNADATNRMLQGAFVHGYVSPGTHEDVARHSSISYVAMSNFNSITAMLRMRDEISEAQSALAAYKLETLKSIQDFMDGRASSLMAPKVLRGLSPNTLKAASVMAAKPAARFFAAGATVTGTGTSGVDMATDDERGPQTLRQALTTAKPGTKMTTALRVDIRNVVSIATRQKLGLSEQQATAIKETFDTPSDSFLDSLSMLDDDTKHALMDSASKVAKFLKEREDLAPKHLAGCAMLSGYDMTNMAPVNSDQAHCYMTAAVKVMQDTTVATTVLDKLTSSTKIAGGTAAGAAKAGAINVAKGTMGYYAAAGATVVSMAYHTARIAFEESARSFVQTDPNSLYQEIRQKVSKDPTNVKETERQEYAGAALFQLTAASLLMGDDTSGVAKHYFPEHKRLDATFTLVDLWASLPEASTMTASMSETVALLERGSVLEILTNADKLKELATVAPNVLGTVVFGGAGNSVPGMYFDKIARMETREGESLATLADNGVQDIGNQIWERHGSFMYVAMYKNPRNAILSGITLVTKTLDVTAAAMRPLKYAWENTAGLRGAIGDKVGKTWEATKEAGAFAKEKISGAYAVAAPVVGTIAEVTGADVVARESAAAGGAALGVIRDKGKQAGEVALRYTTEATDAVLGVAGDVAHGLFQKIIGED